MVYPDVVGIGSEYFVVYLSCLYILCSADNAELLVLLYRLQCFVYHMLSKMRTSSGNLHRVIGEVSVVGYWWCISFRTAVVCEPGNMYSVEYRYVAASGRRQVSYHCCVIVHIVSSL